MTSELGGNVAPLVGCNHDVSSMGRDRILAGHARNIKVLHQLQSATINRWRARTDSYLIAREATALCD
jgi:hypothetical protein